MLCSNMSCDIWSKHTHISLLYIAQQKYIVVRRKAHNNKREENENFPLGENGGHTYT